MSRLEKELNIAQHSSVQPGQDLIGIPKLEKVFGVGRGGAGSKILGAGQGRTTVKLGVFSGQGSIENFPRVGAERGMHPWFR